MTARPSALLAGACLLLLSAVPVLAWAGAAEPATSADEAEPTWSFEGKLTALSDYVWRGVSQTDEKPALQLDVAVTHASGIYVGLWASNVDFGEDDGISVEVDPYIGWSGQVAENGSELDVVLTRVSFPGAKPGYELDYTELEAKLTFPQHFYVGVAYSPNIFRLGARGIYYNVGGEWPLGESGFGLKAQLGHYDLDKAAGDSYEDIQLALTREFGPIQAELSWTDTRSYGPELSENLDDVKLAGSRVQLGLTWSF